MIAPPELDDVAADGDELDPVPASDPLADLLLSVAAIIVLAVLAILPSLPQRAAATAEAEAGFRLDGRRVTPWLATSAGLAIDGSKTNLIPLDRMFSDQTLSAALQGIERAHEPLLLFIAPDGNEAAFQLEAIASRHGIRQIRQVRLEPGCERSIVAHCLRRPPPSHGQIR